MKYFDPTLYLVADRKFARNGNLVDAVSKAILGGVTLVQLRDKDASPSEITEMARALGTLLRRHGVPLLINDHIEIASATGADGVHLGLRDKSVASARVRLGSNAIIGISIESDIAFSESLLFGADYVAASPVFPSKSKLDTGPPFQLVGLKNLRSKFAVPLIAIGGITFDNLIEVLGTGVDGIAVVSAILAAQDEAEAAKSLKFKITEFRRQANATP